MPSHIRIVGLMLIVLMITACAGPNPLQDAAVPISEVSGFWGGLWHGLTLPLSFVGSIVTDYITIYAVQNTGGWYDFGFVLGIILLSGIISVLSE